MLAGLLWIAHRYGPYCVTWAQGLDESELLRRFGGDPSHAWQIPFADISALQKAADYEWLGPDEALNEALLCDEPIIQVGRCADWAFAIEISNTREGARSEVLRMVSAGTVAVSVSQGVKGPSIFGYAQDGFMLAYCDPGFPQYPWEGDPDFVQALFRQTGIDPKSQDSASSAAMFAVAEAIGVRLDRETVAEKPLLSGIIIDPPGFNALI